VLPDFFPEPVLDALNAEADRLLSATWADADSDFVMDPAEGMLMMSRLDARSELLFDLARTAAFMTAAESLLEKAAMPINIKYFGRPGRGAEATSPHQDQVFYDSHFNDERAITFWCPLHEVHASSGSLQYRTPALDYGILLPHLTSGATDFGAELIEAAGWNYTTVPIARGSVLVHHAYAVHRSHGMAADAPRRIFALSYRGSAYRERLRVRASGR
jgi:ectoine hydroxylase-related dioxygenase (phytanoyl-CoA dioxygenase family)